MASAAHDVGIVELTDDEARTTFDAVVRREMGISAEEFLDHWDAGSYEDVDFDEIEGLVEVWMALPLVR